MELLQNHIILLALTFGIFYAARQLQKWTGWIVLNPILVTIVVLIGLLKLTGISYETYSEAGGYIEFWLKPAIVVTVGLFGAVFGFKVLEVWHIKNPYSQGLSIGTASHAVGTSRAMEKGETYGTYASLGLILNGLLTALLAPFVLQIMHVL